jgi:hypothetical protein
MSDIQNNRQVLFATQPMGVRWNALGSYLFYDVVNQPKKYNNNQYHADNNLGKCSKGQYYWMRNKEQYLRTLSKGHRFWVGLLANVYCTVQVHPSWELDQVSSGPADKGRGAGALGGRGQVPAPYGPSRVHLYNTLISLAKHIEHNCTF